jgi:hypothetical protein
VPVVISRIYITECPEDAPHNRRWCKFCIIEHSTIAVQTLKHGDDAARAIQAARDTCLPNLHMIVALKHNPGFDGS